MDKTICIPVTWAEKFLDIYESLSEKPSREDDLRKMVGELHVFLVQGMRELEKCGVTISNIHVNTTKADMQDIARWITNGLKKGGVYLDGARN